jgi:hypothetical protein
MQQAAQVHRHVELAKAPQGRARTPLRAAPYPTPKTSATHLTPQSEHQPGSLSATSSCLRVLALTLLLTAGQLLAGSNEVCHVGAQLHLGAANPAENLRHVRNFVEGGLADYVLLVMPGLGNEEREGIVRYLAEHKVHFLIQEGFPTSAQWFQTPGPAKPGEPPHARYSAADYDQIRRLAGDLFLGVHWGELDSSGLKPEDYLPPALLQHPTRQQVKDALLNHVRSRVDLFHQHCRTPFAHSSAVLSHPLFAEAGMDILCSEIGENVPNFNMMIASNRGAARAYDRPWMIDHSTWWAPRGHAGEQVSPREGHTPWCLFTSLLQAAMGGADVVQFEVDWAAFDAQWRLLPWGQAMKTLYSLTRRIGARGETVTPTAILLGHENGWPGVGWRVGDVRGTGLFDGLRHQFMQTRDADLSLKILDVFYPGFERSGWDPEYPGFLAESPLGVADLVPDNLPASKYSRYRVLVALGYHRMTESLQQSLAAYVKQGGVLVCGDNLFLDAQEKPARSKAINSLIGCEVALSEAKLIHLYQPTGTLDAVEGYAAPASSGEWQDHWLPPLKLTTGSVVARLNNTPFIIENRLGSGRVFFVSALNLVGSNARKRGPEPYLVANLLSKFLHTLNDHIGDGISFSPWTSLEHIYNEKPDGTALLLVLNHGDMEYRRDAKLKNPRHFTAGRLIAQGTWEGWQPGKDLQLEHSANDLKWSFTLSPKSFALFEFSEK